MGYVFKLRFYILGIIFTLIMVLAVHTKYTEHKPLYFTVRVKSYEIRPHNHFVSARFKMRLHVPAQDIQLMYDRPSTQIKQVSLSYFLGYLSKPENKDLNLTLMVTNPIDQSTHPLDLKVLQTSFSPQTEILDFVAEPSNPAEYSKLLKEAGHDNVLKGSDAVLYLDG